MKEKKSESPHKTLGPSYSVFPLAALVQAKISLYIFFNLLHITQMALLDSTIEHENQTRDSVGHSMTNTKQWR